MSGLSSPVLLLLFELVELLLFELFELLLLPLEELLPPPLELAGPPQAVRNESASKSANVSAMIFLFMGVPSFL